MMLYAQVVLGIAVEGPFDYEVPGYLQNAIRPGSRVEVFLRRQRMIGYVVALSRTTAISNVRSIVRLIDDLPLLDETMLLLTRQVADYYCCSWGEVIETALPERLRRGARLSGNTPAVDSTRHPGIPQVTLVHDFEPDSRWGRYISAIHDTLKAGKGVVVIVPDEESLVKADAILKKEADTPPVLLLRKSAQEVPVWESLRCGKAPFVLGLRSAVFAPLPDPGLMIVDDESNEAYKQDQVPHYHCRDVALMRSRLQNIPLILGSTFPSVESFYLARKNKMAYTRIERKRQFPEVKILNMRSEFQMRARKKALLSKLLEDAIAGTLASGGKTLLFLNRTGFSTWAACHNCGAVLRCPRCSSNLVYHYSENILRCHLCAFTLEPPKICPQCSAGYIRYSGAGTEKIESELSRIFPQARIRRLDKGHPADLSGMDICIATRSITKETGLRFDLVGVFGIDNALNRIDFRAAEKVYGLLAGLACLTDNKFYIQTGLAKHPCFDALLNKDVDSFYQDELKHRKQLLFPPYRHLLQIKLRGSNEEKVKTASQALYERLNADSSKSVTVVSVSPGPHPKLRGKYHWYILISAADVKKANVFIKIHLQDFRHSGIIVTIDVDPA